ncbi:hypothetical protein JWG41_16435 [Leptospira sp. 201903075]|uniref:hypothetical protein n=1 Tax=Leptospira chreensis TaxID=2810035 RepID=UPI0019644E89|nr:hypothetical protein [Leptospira chreensis]MBM9592038.1 hypothetical protein [Leptospira chreensis]
MDFKKLEKDLYESEQYLKNLNFTIQNNSSIEAIILASTKLFEQDKGSIPVEQKWDFRQTYRDILGFHDIVEKIKKISNHPCYTEIIPHINLLAESKFQQNDKSSVLDSNSNKVFELYLSLACMRISQKVKLDNPNISKGDNPDIIFDYEGQSIGIACKVLHSPNPKGIFQHIEKSIDQIEKSEATKGLIVISLKNIIDHDDFWKIQNLENVKNGTSEPEFNTFANSEDAKERLNSYVKPFFDYYSDPIELTALNELFLNKKTPPEFYFFLNSITSVMEHGRQRAINFKRLFRINIKEGILQPITHSIADKINHYIQYDT